VVSTTKARRESPSAFVPFSVGWGGGGFRAALFCLCYAFAFYSIDIAHA
jgi:hypothetical protein